MKPPAYLTKRARIEWRALVDRFGLEFFPREMHPLLATMCAVVVDLRDINAILRREFPEVPSGDHGDQWRRFCELVKLRGQLAAQLCFLSVKLKISKTSRDVRGSLASRYERRAARPALAPWDDDALDALRRPRKNGH